LTFAYHVQQARAVKACGDQGVQRWPKSPVSFVMSVRSTKPFGGRGGRCSARARAAGLVSRPGLPLRVPLQVHRQPLHLNHGLKVQRA
jgi:hypothetical protein